jgi:hypothetical protein
MSEYLIPYLIAFILIVLVWWMIFFIVKKWTSDFINPYKYKKLKNIWKPIQTKIVDINRNSCSSSNLFSSNITINYFILEYFDNKKEKHLYTVNSDFLKSKISAWYKIFSKKVAKNLKIGDSIKCYINPKNNKEYYIDPKDIFIDFKYRNFLHFLFSIFIK